MGDPEDTGGYCEVLPRRVTVAKVENGYTAHAQFETRRAGRDGPCYEDREFVFLQRRDLLDWVSRYLHDEDSEATPPSDP